MSGMRTRLTWFLGGYFIGKYYHAPEKDGAGEPSKGDNKPCLMLMNAMRSTGIILSDDEAKRQLDRCEAGLADLNSINNVGDAIHQIKRRFS